MIPEALVLIGDQHVDELRVDLVERRGEPPAAVRVGEGAQQLAVAVGDFGGDGERRRAGAAGRRGRACQRRPGDAGKRGRGEAERARVRERRGFMGEHSVARKCPVSAAPPHPSSASLGHPLPGGERRLPSPAPGWKGEGGAWQAPPLPTGERVAAKRPGEGHEHLHRHCPPPYGALTSIMPVAVRAEYCGRYMSSTLAAGWAKTPGVTARTT